MKYSIGKAISKSIKENKWLCIDYVNLKGEESSFWCSIEDVDIERKILKADIFNIFKSNEVVTNGRLYFDRIKKAKIIEGTYCPSNPRLVEKIERNITKLPWLEFDNFDDRILEYYSEAKKLDNDPFQSVYSNVPGLDVRTLLQKQSILLDEEQFEIIAKDIYKNEDVEKTNRHSQLAINRFSISSQGKLYVVVYYPLSLDVRKKSLVIHEDWVVNKSFLVGEAKVSLSSYLTSSPDDYISYLHDNFEEAKNSLRENLCAHEILDENPLLMLISRNVNLEYDAVYESIAKKHKEGTLQPPMKAFFGELSKRNRGNAKPDIVLMDKKADIDQIRVVYNAMRQPVTYVQGPPGTGKTTTLVNVVVSSFFSDRTCLVCSNNNQPIDDIMKKFSFEGKYGKIHFPVLRLGNRDVLSKSLGYMKELLDFNDEKIRIYEDKLKSLNEKVSQGYDDLKSLLSSYEEKKEILADKSYLDHFYRHVMESEESSARLKNKIREQMEFRQAQLEKMPDITEEQVLSKCKFVKDDPDFLMYLYFNSFKYLKKLKQPLYAELREIILEQDEESKVNRFAKWLRDDANFKKLLRVFPIICCTNISCLRLGGNETYFDICIMDEAGQCDVASSLIPISKSKRLLLVGDVNQLQPVITLDPTINEKLILNYEVPKQYDYCHNSIMNLMTSVDDISPQILLSFHYRCGKRIVSYSNERYYRGKLNIKTDQTDHQLEFVSVKNNAFADERNSYAAEAQAVVRYIKENGIDENDVTIITPFRNQASLIHRLLVQNNLRAKCGTIHMVQGAENKVILFSPGIGLKSSKRTYDWIANNKELINVAVTRAKDRFVILGDDDAIKALSHKDVEDDIVALVDYVKKNGRTSVSKSEVNNIEIGLSNGSEFENQLFATMTHFCSVYRRFSIKRNQAVRKVLPDIQDEELKNYFSKAEFDLVLYSKNFFGRPTPRIVMELNGGEHYLSKSRSALNDGKKMEICRRNKIDYIAIPNAYSRSYETLSDLIFALSGEEDEGFALF